MTRRRWIRFTASWLFFAEGWLFGYFLDWKWAVIWCLIWTLLALARTGAT